MTDAKNAQPLNWLSLGIGLALIVFMGVICANSAPHATTLIIYEDA
jgi:hypothetical protein